MFFEQILKSIKVVRKIMKNSLSTSCPFWQQEEYKLTSADVLYQMVGLFDDRDWGIKNGTGQKIGP